MLTAPTTQGIKYAGSKLKILPYILSAISGLEIKTVLDGFSGTTRVSQLLAKMGFDTTANDISAWSEVFGYCYLMNDKPSSYYEELISHLNGVKGYESWFSVHYGGTDTGIEKKHPFQLKNTMKLDAIRDEIDKLRLNQQDKYVALTSLILALDAVDSTLGHFASYLASWSPRSNKDLNLKVPDLFISAGKNTVLKEDIFQTIERKQYDLAYFDPPYGSNNEKMPASRVRYTSYYHIWTSIILNDRPAVFGKVNRREDSRDTQSHNPFEDFRNNEAGQFIAMESIRKLVANTQARYILLSYSSGGRATKEELYDIIQGNGTLLKAFEIDYKHHAMATMRSTNDWINSDKSHTEYLFLVEKR